MNLKIGAIKSIAKGKLESWKTGIPNCGDIFNIFGIKKVTDDVDCYLQFNIYNPYLKTLNKNIEKSYLHILNSDKPFLVCEEGIFRQYPNYKRYGWNSYKNSKGIFNNEVVSNDRLKKFKKENALTIKDFNPKGNYILIMGQLEYDSALIELYEQGYKSFNEYIEHIILQIRRYTDRKIIFRPHPKMLFSRNISGVVPEKVSYYKSLIESWNLKYNLIDLSCNYDSGFQYDSLNGGNGLLQDISLSYCVITFNSNSAIESIIEGKPTYTLDITSPAYDIGIKDLSVIESLPEPKNLEKWLEKIVYTTWNEQEVASGEAWNHYKSVYFKDKK